MRPDILNEGNNDEGSYYYYTVGTSPELASQPGFPMLAAAEVAIV